MTELPVRALLAHLDEAKRLQATADLSGSRTGSRGIHLPTVTDCVPTNSASS